MNDELASPTRFHGDLAADDFDGFDDLHGTAEAPLILLHGLTFDRRQWGPLLTALAASGASGASNASGASGRRRRIVAFDLPGHGDSRSQDSYRSVEIVQSVHRAAHEAGLTGTGREAPVLVGHSIGAVFATAYAAVHPARAVVNLDQPLAAEGFAQMLRGLEPVLRGPDFISVWESLLARMGTDELSPAARRLVEHATTPRQDLLLGYWGELLTVPLEQLAERRTRQLEAIRANGVAYHHISSRELDPGYQGWLKSVLPDACVRVLPGGGHFPHLAHPERLAEILGSVG